MTLTSSLVAGADGLGLISSQFDTSLLGLGLVDVLHQDTLVLEDVTLDLEVELVVHVLVDLAGLAVLAKHATEDTHAAEPNDLGGHAALAGTTTLTDARVAALGLGLSHATDAEARVDGLGLLDDKTVLDQLADSLA